jgi:hypothetical protein
MATSNSDGNERAAFLRFARRAALMLPVIALVPLLNYTVDPGNVFTRGKEEASIARELAAGRNVANFDKFDARIISRELISRVTYHPDVIVLGTSRTLNFHENLFPGKRILNVSVLSGTLPDLLGLYELVRARKLSPSVVLLGIDPWMLNSESSDIRTVALSDAIDSIQHRLGVHIYEPSQNKTIQEKVRTLFSADYFQQSARQLVNGTQHAKWHVAANRDNDEYTRLPDGSFSYSSAERASDSAAVMERAAEYMRPPVFGIGRNRPVSGENLAALAKLIELIRRDGAEPQIYLPPYHPYVFEQISADPAYRIVADGEAALRSLAAEKSVRIFGSYNPSSYGLQNADFYDGHHLREEGIAKVLAGVK